MITGKTGTLTEGDMRVSHISINDVLHENTSPDYFEKSEVD